MEYSIGAYGEMLADRVRMDAYRSAIEKMIRPGVTVLDLGAGPCIAGLWSCHYGAARVFAVDVDSSFALGKAIVMSSKYSSRFQFLKDLSIETEHLNCCQVIVSDLRGILPLYRQHIPSIVDARRWWLERDGLQIPEHDTVYAAIVSNETVFNQHYSGWANDMDGWSFAAARQLLANSFRKATFGADDLLSTAEIWMLLDYYKILHADHQAELQWTMNRAGVAHGVAMWFESDLIDGVRMSNRPGHPELIYGQQFFPWPEPVALSVGDSVIVQMRAHLLDDDYVWAWQSQIIRRDGGKPIQFEQSTFQTQLLSSEQLSRLRLDKRPLLEPQGRAMELVLAEIEAKSSLEKVASTLQKRFSDLFPDNNKALAFVSQMYGKYWR